MQKDVLLWESALFVFDKLIIENREKGVLRE